MPIRGRRLPHKQPACCPNRPRPLPSSRYTRRWRFRGSLLAARLGFDTGASPETPGPLDSTSARARMIERAEGLLPPQRLAGNRLVPPEFDFEHSVGCWIAKDVTCVETSLWTDRAIQRRHLLSGSMKCSLGGVLARLFPKPRLAERMGIEALTWPASCRGWARWLSSNAPAATVTAAKRFRPSAKADAVWSRMIDCCHAVRARAAEGLSVEELATFKRTCDDPDPTSAAFLIRFEPDLLSGRQPLLPRLTIDETDPVARIISEQTGLFRNPCWMYPSTTAWLEESWRGVQMLPVRDFSAPESLLGAAIAGPNTGEQEACPPWPDRRKERLRLDRLVSEHLPTALRFAKPTPHGRCVDQAEDVVQEGSRPRGSQLEDVSRGEGSFARGCFAS